MDEDFTQIGTSIDENDIIIFPSNGSEMEESLEFVPDHFALNNSTVSPPSATNISATVTTVNSRPSSFHRQDSEEFEDETFVERLYGLTEMFPNWVHVFVQNTFQYSKIVGHWMKKTLWFCSSSFLILILPILVQWEFNQAVESQAAQTRQILLGPSAQVGSNGFTL